MSAPVILAFNLNLGNTVLCDKYYQNKTDALIPEEGYIFKRKACHNPLFYDDMVKEITYEKPQIVVITTEEKNTGYFHSDFLPDHLPSIGYNELATYQYKSVNMSIYVNRRYSGYKVIDSDYGTYGKNIFFVVQFLQTPLGYIALVGFDRTSNFSITFNEVGKTIDRLLETYVNDSNAFTSIVMGNVNNDYEGNQNYIYIHKNTQPSKYNAIIIDGETLDNGLVKKISFNIQKPKIMIFSWNTDQTPLCDKYHNTREQHYRKKYFQNKPCYSPDFFKQLYDKNIVNEEIVDDDEKEIIYDEMNEKEVIYNNDYIDNNTNNYVSNKKLSKKNNDKLLELDVSIHEQQPDIVVIHTEGDLETGTFFHYEFLRTHMKNYILLDNEKISHIGKKNIDNYALRMSIYVRNDLEDEMKSIHNGFFNNNVIKCEQKITKKLKGGVYSETNDAKALIKFVDTKYGVFAFMGLQIPHEFEENKRNECLAKFVKQLENNKDVSYIFMMGDFSEHLTNDDFDQYEKQHHFNYLNNVFDYYQEGHGRRLTPNYQFNQLSVSQRQNFDKDTYKRSNYGNNVGFHDRIFHGTNDTSLYDITCIYYDSIFGYPMLAQDKTKSQHIGVMGLYGLDKVTVEKNDQDYI